MDKSNLIVNYLPTTFNESDLKEMFERYGPIQSIKVVRDKTTGISMGFGFVNFESNEDAQAAVDALNSTRLPEGKRMKVSVARPAWKANIHSNLYVSGIPTSYTHTEVNDLFGPDYESHIESIRMLFDQDGERFRGIAVVRFDTEESSYNAMRAFAGVQLTDEVTNITTTLQLKPWRPEFRPDRVDSDAVRYQLFSTKSGLYMPYPGIEPVAGGGTSRGGRSLSTGAFNLKTDDTGTEGLSWPQQRVHSGTQYRARFASSNTASARRRGGYRTAAPQVDESQQASWDSAWNEYVWGEGKMIVLLGDVTNSSKMEYVADFMASSLSRHNSGGGGQRTPLAGKLSTLNSSSALLALPTTNQTLTALFIFHLPPECDDATLKVLFEPYGAIDSVKVVAGRGYGFVNYFDFESVRRISAKVALGFSRARKAVDSLNGFKLGSKRLKVEFKKTIPSRTADTAAAGGGVKAMPSSSQSEMRKDGVFPAPDGEPVSDSEATRSGAAVAVAAVVASSSSPSPPLPSIHA
ncbi:hypothetical protein FOL47_005246 [Perkinsus chesapeaki]|uniref:RRM domain-containing protein n=1 Tax=Perkinsus chesapeaki TaxID=330153 RepID=A0A7J6LY59_PERCH|nr:hypothetical protein FOL47_005246 [Perkinsus chesapeaki]